MTKTNKLEYIKQLLPAGIAVSDVELSVYIDLTKQEIINWKYSLVGVPKDVEDVPTEDEITQVMACVAGYGQRGAPNEESHSENGITRHWKHSDMLAYVRANVIPYARVI